MKSNKKITAKIFRDCLRATFAATIVYLLSNIAEGIVSVYTSKTLGAFSDTVFNLDFTSGIASFTELLICLVITIIGIPVVHLIADKLIFSGALKHDRVVLNQVMRKNYLDMQKISAGEAQQRLDDDPCELRLDFVNLVGKYISVSFTAVFLLYNAIKINPIYTIIVLGLSLLKLIVPIIVRKTEARFQMEERDYGTKMRSLEMYITSNPHNIKILGIYKALIDKLSDLFEKHYQLTFLKKLRYNTVTGAILGFTDSFCSVAVLVCGAVMASNGVITVGSIVAMTGYFSVFNSVIGTIGSIIKDTPILRNDIERMAVLYEGEEKNSGEELLGFKSICSDNLSFEYNNDEKVINNLSFTIQKGDKVAICGKNGSGKSTLLKILCGILHDYQGEIHIGGKELSELSVSSWRNMIAYAEQDPFLFAGTVRENIRLGYFESSDDDINKIMDDFGIGYLADRTVSMNQDDLSGGEKQKISIARAMLKKTPIIFLDEPNNNLDLLSREWLENFIKTSDKTIVFISHSNSLSECADLKIQMDVGKV